MWSWLIGAVLKPLFGAIVDWLNAQQARIDEQRLGQAQQATADANQQTAAANAATKTVAAEAQAEADAPRTVSDIEKRLGDGTA